MNVYDLIPCLGYKILEGFIGFSNEPQHSAAIDFYSVPRPQHSSYSVGLAHRSLTGPIVTESMALKRKHPKKSIGITLVI